MVDTHSLPFPPLLHPLPLLHALRHVHLGLGQNTKILKMQKYVHLGLGQNTKNTQNTEICPSWSWSKYRITQNTKILTKAQRTQELSALTKETAFKSYKKLIKIQHENLDQNSAPKYRPNFNHH